MNKLSVRVKIIGSMVTLVLAMLLVSIYSFYQVRDLDHRVSVLASSVIPLNEALAKSEIHLLNQNILLDQIALKPRHHQKQILRSDFSQINKQFHKEVGEVTKQLQEAIHLISHSRNPKPLMEALKITKNLTENPLAATDLKTMEKGLAKTEADLEKVRSLVSKVISKEANSVAIGEVKSHHTALFIAFLVFALAVIISPLISHKIVLPLREMATASKAIASGDLSTRVKIHTQDEVGQLGQSFNKMAEELKQKEQIKETFGRYLDPRIVESLITKDAPGGVAESQKKEMTIFFSDLEKFSTLTEKLSADGIVKLLNEYFSTVTEPISKNNGVLDKFIGDAVMAFWGPPFSNGDNHPDLACEAALKQFEKVKTLNSRLNQIIPGIECPEIRFRVGICTGEVVVGNIGSTKNQSYTVMGDTVNIAARLESANKQFGTRILLSDQTQKGLSSHFVTRKVDQIVVVGKVEPVTIYELLGTQDNIKPEVLKIKKLYEEALSLYLNQEWDQALKHLHEILEIQLSDGPARVLKERIEHFKANPPQDTWDGVWKMASK